jgi:hypothetical protein
MEEARQISGRARNPPYVHGMKSNHDDTQTIGIAGLLLSLVSLMVSLHLGGYFVVAVASAGIGVAVGVALTSKRRC